MRDKRTIRVHIAKRQDKDVYSAAFKLPLYKEPVAPTDIMELPDNLDEARAMLSNYIKSHIVKTFPKGIKFIIRYYVEAERVEIVT